MNWNPATTPPPMLGPGIPSAPVLAFLDDGSIVAAEFWQSTQAGQPPKWYLSRTVHLYPEPFREICETVVGWLEIMDFQHLPNGIAVRTKRVTP